MKDTLPLGVRESHLDEFHGLLSCMEWLMGVNRLEELGPPWQIEQENSELKYMGSLRRGELKQFELLSKEGIQAKSCEHGLFFGDMECCGNHMRS